MALNTGDVRALYRRRANAYDLSTRIYALLGVRLERYRRVAVGALDLKPGGTVVDLGCGTGLNFSPLQERIGPNGKIIGVDLTDAMLEQASERVETAGWRNVELVERDLAGYEPPERVNAVLSTFAITFLADYDGLIERCAHALAPAGRLAILDLKRPTGWPEWLVRLGAWLNSPYGVTLDLSKRHPWESVERHFDCATYNEYYFGAVYLSVGARSSRQGGKPST